MATLFDGLASESQQLIYYSYFPLKSTTVDQSATVTDCSCNAKPANWENHNGKLSGLRLGSSDSARFTNIWKSVAGQMIGDNFTISIRLFLGSEFCSEKAASSRLNPGNRPRRFAAPGGQWNRWVGN